MNPSNLFGVCLRSVVTTCGYINRTDGKSTVDSFGALKHSLKAENSLLPKHSYLGSVLPQAGNKPGFVGFSQLWVECLRWSEVS